MLLMRLQTQSNKRSMTRLNFRRAGLGGLALLLSACDSEPVAPEPATPDERAAIAEAEAMIEEGRPEVQDEGAPQPDLSE